jgi:hypothetical protein
MDLHGTINELIRKQETKLNDLENQIAGQVNIIADHHLQMISEVLAPDDISNWKDTILPSLVTDISQKKVSLVVEKEKLTRLLNLKAKLADEKFYSAIAQTISSFIE